MKRTVGFAVWLDDAVPFVAPLAYVLVVSLALGFVVLLSSELIRLFGISDENGDLISMLVIAPFVVIFAPSFWVAGSIVFERVRHISGIYSLVFKDRKDSLWRLKESARHFASYDTDQ